MTERLIKIFDRAVSGITLLTVIAAAVFIIPRIWGWKPYIVLSGSMEPAVHTGAVAFIDTGNREYAAGDIVTYRVEGRDQELLVTHRIVGKEGKNYVTKGDANDVSDPAPVTPGQIVGKYVFQIPFAGYLAGKWNAGTLTAGVFWIALLNGMSAALEAAGSAEGAFDKKERKESGTKSC